MEIQLGPNVAFRFPFTHHKHNYTHINNIIHLRHDLMVHNSYNSYTTSVINIGSFIYIQVSHEARICITNTNIESQTSPILKEA